MLLPTLSGIILVMMTLVIHAFGTLGLLRFIGRRFTDGHGTILTHRILHVLLSMKVGLLLLHVLEISLWAMAYFFLLPPNSSLDTWEKSVYFSFVTYTTLGYGDLTLTLDRWRLLSGIEALNGVLLLGWSTALLFALVQKSWHTLVRHRT